MPAFANGSIDAWAVWDPYFAIGEKRQNARILVNAHEIARTNSFYIANRDFANNYVRETREVIDGLGEAARWAENNRPEVAAALAAITGFSVLVPLACVAWWMKRQDEREERRLAAATARKLSGGAA